MVAYNPYRYIQFTVLAVTKNVVKNFAVLTVNTT
jgi:hypothetical protein